MSSSDVAISIQGLSKAYTIAHGALKRPTFRDVVTERVRHPFRRPRLETFWALKDVSFDVKQGEVVGIIGRNGAGKSTLLKILSRITEPTSGRVELYGRVGSLLEVGTGFHPELTGRENVFLNGAILGMTRGEIRGKLEAIVSFAGLERFLDMPVKRYSSGMYARLGFSIAAHVDPQVLLVDEVLSVGDAVFRLRCLDRMRRLVREGTTLVFVTHDLQQMQTICGRTIVLEEGKVSFEGSPPDAVSQYLRPMSRVYADRPADVAEGGNGRPGSIELLNFRLLDAGGDEVVWIRPDDEVRIELTIRLTRTIPRLVVETNLRAPASNTHISLNSGRDAITFPGEAGLHRVTLLLAGVPLAGGQYYWNVRMWDADRGTNELDTPFRYPMVINDGGRATGALCLDHDWSFDAPPCLPTGGDESQTGRERLEECGKLT